MRKPKPIPYSSMEPVWKRSVRHTLELYETGLLTDEEAIARIVFLLEKALLLGDKQAVEYLEMSVLHLIPVQGQA